MTQTDICNQALVQTGAATIADFDTDDSFRAELCRLYYASAVRHVFEQRAWSFACQWANSTGDESPISDGYIHEPPVPALPEAVLTIPALVLPEDTIVGGRFGVLRNLAPGERIEWRVVDNYSGIAIWSPEERLMIAWRYYHLDPEQWGGEAFTDTIVYKLASKLCLPLTKNQSLKQAMDLEYAHHLEEAWAFDDQAGESQASDSSVLTARFTA